MSVVRGIVIDTGLSIRIDEDDAGNRTFTWLDEHGAVRFYPGEIAIMLRALRSLDASAEARPGTAVEHPEDHLIAHGQHGWRARGAER